MVKREDGKPIKNTLLLLLFTLLFLLLLVIDSHRPEEHWTPEWVGQGKGNEKKGKTKSRKSYPIHLLLL